ncbi:MAG TPA: DUF3352 domain-containing protein [Nocardioides sp.]|nr:DUF3352 domain-containing protein [Nocardioides sp.]
MSAVLGSTPDLPTPAPRKGRWTRRVIAGSAGVLLVGGLTAAGFGARWYLHTGAQPAEALPSSTLAYLAVDLDPSGKQKLAAKGVLDKLPIAKSDDLGGVGDLRKEIVDKLLSSGSCSGKSYEHDVKPWLGERAAVAMVKVDDGPQPVLVLQSNDDGKADKGLQALSECGGSDFGGWDVRDGWIVWTEKKEYADAVVDAAKNGTLADDPAYKDMVDEAGGTGLVTGYVAPSAIRTLVSSFALESPLPAGMVQQLADRVPSIALTVRAEGGEVRADVVATLPKDNPTTPASVEPALADLPAGSSAVLAVRPSEGMSSAAFKSAFDAGLSSSIPDPAERRQADQFFRRTLGAPIETVLQDVLDGTLVAVLGPTTADDFGRSPDQLPIAARLTPAADRKDRVLGYFEKLSRQLGLDQWAEVSGDSIVAGTSPDARAKALSGGGLTGSARFRSVIDLDGHDVSSLLYVDLHSGLVTAALEQGLVGEPKALENLKKLSAIGLAGWLQDGKAHAQLRIALD